MSTLSQSTACCLQERGKRGESKKGLLCSASTARCFCSACCFAALLAGCKLLCSACCFFAVLAALLLLQCLLLAASSTAKAAVQKAASTAAFAVLAALQCLLLFCSACCLQALLAFALSHIYRVRSWKRVNGICTFVPVKQVLLYLPPPACCLLCHIAVAELEACK